MSITRLGPARNVGPPRSRERPIASDGAGTLSHVQHAVRADASQTTMPTSSKPTGPVEVGYRGVPHREPTAPLRAPTTPLAARSERRVDAYFSADVETDGPIPGPYSMLSFALVFAGRYDGEVFARPASYDQRFYAELKPISSDYQLDALAVNGLDRTALLSHGREPASAMTEAADWVRGVAGGARPVLVAYPLSFDWTWLYWYFVRFSASGSPFNHSSCFDIKTAFAVKGRLPVASAGRSGLFEVLKSQHGHTHHAVDDAIEQAQIFANLFEWEGSDG